ncbi:MAG: hypothetical protein AAF560_16480 [Acidobacteriota bacterium]
MNRPQQDIPTAFFKCFTLAAVITSLLLAVVQPIAAEPREQELELDPGTEKSSGTITCGDNYVQGRFDDIVWNYSERDDGLSSWRLKDDAVLCVQQSSLNCDSPSRIYIKLVSDSSANKNETINRWHSNAALAEVLGLEVVITWYNLGGSWPVCAVKQFQVNRPV